MLQTIATFVSVFAGVIGIVAFGLGVTRTSRLRRREQLYRDALTALPSTHGSSGIVSALHRATVAEIAARDLTSPWRVLWPWLAWLAVVSWHAVMSYLVCGYLATHAEWSYQDFMTSIGGEGGGVLFTVGLIYFYLSALPDIFANYIYAILGRAVAARALYDGKAVARPKSYSELKTEEEVKSYLRSLKADTKKNQHTRYAPHGAVSPREVPNYLQRLIPGIFAAMFGLYCGMMYWSRDKDQTISRDTLGLWPTFILVGGSLSLVLMMLVASKLRSAMETLALPRQFSPQSIGPRRRDHRGSSRPLQVGTSSFPRKRGRFPTASTMASKFRGIEMRHDGG